MDIYVIDPRDATKYDRNDAELQEFALFAACVTGKTAKIIAKQVHDLLGPHQGLPFDIIRQLSASGKLESELRRARLGQYNRLLRTLPALAEVDLRSCDLSELEGIYGIGPKTARYILLHTRKGFEAVPLDTHILKFLRSLGHKTPKSTPTSHRQYSQLESEFILEAKRHGKTVAEFDLEIWNASSRV